MAISILDYARSPEIDWSSPDPLEVEVQLSPLLLLLTAPLVRGAELDAALLTTAVLVLAVAVHALGQAVVFCRLGKPFSHLRLLPTGAVALPVLPGTFRSRVLAGAAGLAGPLLLAAGTAGGALAAREAGLPAESDRLAHAAVLLGGFALLQLLPALPLEGGRLLRDALASRISFRAASVAALFATFLTATVLVGVGGGQPLFLIAGLYLVLAGGEETRRVCRQPDLDRVCVSAGVSELLPELSRGDSSRLVLRTLILAGRRSLPVVENRELVGVVELETLLRCIAARDSELYAAEVMLRPPPPLYPEASLRLALTRMENARVGLLSLEEGGQLRGFVTREQLLARIVGSEPAPATDPRPRTSTVGAAYPAGSVSNS